MHPIEVTSSNFEEIVLKSQVPVLVDFWAPWCGPCKMITPVLEAISAEFEGKAIIAKINVDDSPEIASEYGIRSIPTLMLFKNGEMVDSKVGLQSKEILVNWLS